MFKTSSTNETRRKNDKRSDIFINRTLEIRTRKNLLFFYNPFLQRATKLEKFVRINLFQSWIVILSTNIHTTFYNVKILPALFIASFIIQNGEYNISSVQDAINYPYIYF